MQHQLPPNFTLRRLMGAYGFTHEGLAEAVNIAAERLIGTPGGCGARHVRRWLSGEVAWPRSRSRLALEEVFGRPATELGFKAPGCGAVRATVSTLADLSSKEPPVERRKFVLGCTGALIALPVLPESGRLGMCDVERIRGTSARLHQLDDRHGGAQLTDIGAAYFEHVEHTSRHCTFTSMVQTDLYRVLGELAASTGWFAFDAGQHHRSRQWWDTGLRYALLARDTGLQARIWSHMARQAVDVGHGSEAVAVSRAALDTTHNRRDPRLSALLHSRVALGHSVMQEKGRCGQSLARAEQELDRADRAPERWLAFVGPAEIMAQASLCHDNLGAHGQALALRQQAVQLRDASFRRNQFCGQVHLAECHLAAGGAEEAIAAGSEALDMLPDVGSPRWGKRLAAFRDRVQTCGAKGAEFAEHYDSVVKPRDGAAS